MNDLVIVEGEQLTTNSILIADGVGVQHKNVIALIRDNLGDLEEFGEVAFETRLNSQGTATEYAILNEQQATIIITYMRNTATVRKFKKLLVKQFYEMREALKNLPDPHAAMMERLELARTVPRGYFCVFYQSVDVQYTLAKHINYGKELIPDISIGWHWSDYITKQKQNIKNSRIRWVDFKYPKSWNMFVPYVWVYNNSFMGDFDDWFRGFYLPEKFPSYIKGCVQKGKLPAKTVLKLINDMVELGQLPKDSILKCLPKKELKLLK
jgi:phage regulator Rha-like protein